MRFTSALLLSLFALNSAFVLHSQNPFVQHVMTLSSTLAPDTPDLRVAENDSRDRGALSMQIDELAEILGGKEPAQIVWDCYSLGIEPTQFHGNAMNLGYDDFESIYSMLPAKRRSQRLRPETIKELEKLYQKQGGKVEGGVASLSFISRATDSTTKLFLKLSDGLEITTAIVPRNGDQSTLCISTQVGCRQQCTLCTASGTGRIRNLTTDEILAQMFFAKKICRLEGLPDVGKIVFKGMGEAAENAEAVVKATEILTNHELFRLPAAKVTVSTLAPSPEAFEPFAKAPCLLSWSLYAVNDELRRKLVPTTRYRMTELREGLIQTLLDRPARLRSTLLDVVLIKGVNDGIEHADELAEFARVITETVPDCKLTANVSPFNGNGNTKFEKPNHDDVVAFQKRLRSHGLVFAHVRTKRYDDRTAACGQLSTKGSHSKH